MTTSKEMPSFEKTAELLSALHPAVRIGILQSIGSGECCVCHLEKALGLRQAFLSQHLMALRKAGLIASRREGRFIYYRVSDPKVFDLIKTAARLAGTPLPASDRQPPAAPQCTCPSCRGERPDAARRPAAQTA